MGHRLSTVLATLILLLATLNVAEARSKKEIRQSKCDNSVVNCGIKCSKLIDIDNNIRDCENECDIKYAKCSLRTNKASETAPGIGDNTVNKPALSKD